MAVELKSPAFHDGGAIPVKYTGDGDDVSPPLAWSGAPAEAKSFALICDDPDAPVGTFSHWVVYDIPAEAKELGEALPQKGLLDGGAKQGVNDFGKTGYGGPHPPPGKRHRYFFKLYCLDKKIELQPGLAKAELLDLMQGHIIEQAELVGTYER